MRLGILITLFLMVSCCWAQRTITGQVVGQQKQPVEGALISLKSDSSSTQTNALGFFQIEIGENEELIIEKSGYELSLVPTPQQDRVLITLERIQNLEIEEVDEKYEKGLIIDGEKKGIWEYYLNEKLMLKIDHNTQELLYQFPDTVKCAVLINDKYQKVLPDRFPMYVEGPARMYYMMTTAAEKYIAFDETRKSGFATILFEIDTLGHGDNYKILRSSRKDFGKYMIKALKKIDPWITAEYEGKARRVRLITMIEYSSGKTTKISEDFDHPLATPLVNIHIDSDSL